jgi:hypothetical protein
MATKKPQPKRVRRPDPRRNADAVTIRLDAASITRSEYEMDARLSRLDITIAEVAGVANELEARLARITFPDNSGEAKNGDANPVPVMTKIGQELDGHATRVMLVAKQLRSILDRLGI